MNKRMMLGIFLMVIVALSLSGCMVVFGEPQLFIKLNVDTDKVLQLEYGTTQKFILTATDQNLNKWTGSEVAEWTVDDKVGSLDKNSGLEVELTAGNEDAEGKVTVKMGDKTLSVNVKVVEEIIDPLVWSESFEEFTTEAVGWEAVAVAGAPDGSKVLTYTAGAEEGVSVFLTMPEVARGRLEFSVYQVSGGSSNFGIKPAVDSNEGKIVDFWFSSGGRLKPGNAEMGTGSWNDYRIEWDAEAGKVNVYTNSGSGWNQIAAEAMSGTETPNGITMDGGKSGSGSVDNFKLWDLDLM